MVHSPSSSFRNIFITQRKTWYPLVVIPHFPCAQPLAKRNACCLHELAILHISYKRIIQCVFLRVWILSLSVVFLRYIHVVDHGYTERSSFLFIFLLLPPPSSHEGPQPTAAELCGSIQGLGFPDNPLQCPELQINVRSLTSLGQW